jgi:hypothetical protein
MKSRSATTPHSSRRSVPGATSGAGTGGIFSEEWLMLSILDEEWLVDLFDNTPDYWDRLTDWERGFMTDLQKRYEEEGSGMVLSSRMRVCLVRIQDKEP